MTFVPFAADMVNFTNHVVQMCRDVMTAAMNKLHAPPRFEWVLLFDNSGSMSVRRNECAEALVLLVESLRKLECAFAVATFGNEGRQVVVKNLADDFNLTLGEQMLASLTFDEGSKLFSGVLGVANKIFPDRQKEEVASSVRIMLIVTDALSQELASNLDKFRDLAQRKQITLSVLNTSHDTRKHDEIESCLREMTQTLYEIVNDREKNQLAEMSAKLMQRILQGLVEQTLKDATSIPGRSPSTSSLHALPAVKVYGPNGPEGGRKLISTDAYDLPARVGRMDLKSAKEAGCADTDILYRLSPAGNTIPKCYTPDGSETTTGSLSPEWQSGLDTALAAAIKTTEDYYQKAASDASKDAVAAVTMADQKWHSAQLKLQSEVADCVTVFEEYMMPVNRFTRRRADLSGSQLYLPGLIKAVSTNFTYKKIFSTRTAGGRREYAVAFALDISMSMRGHLLECAIEVLAILIGAMQSMQIDTFSILLFGDGVRIIKLEWQPWESVTAHALLSKLSTADDAVTLDADAVACATELLKRSTVRGPKRLFVLTDGYGSTGARLSMQLKNAEEQNGIEVVALAVGSDKFNVSSTYQHWIEIKFPRVLPDVLRAFYNRDDAPTQPNPSVKPPAWASKMKSSETEENMQTILDEGWRLFAEFRPDQEKARDMQLIEGGGGHGMSLDLCFLVDCTGSMSPFIAVAKEQIKTILQSGDSVISKVKAAHNGIELEVRAGLLGYRDIDEEASEVLIPFTTDMDSLVRVRQSSHVRLLADCTVWTTALTSACE
jgi:hypothetical protein